MFQVYLSWIHVAPFSLFTRQWSYHWQALHHFLVYSSKERIVHLHVNVKVIQGKTSSKSSAGSPGARWFFLQKRWQGLVTLTPACTTLTPGLQNSSTSRLSKVAAQLKHLIVFCYHLYLLQTLDVNIYLSCMPKSIFPGIQTVNECHVITWIFLFSLSQER